MKVTSRRLFISDLPENIQQTDIEEKVNRFGTVTSIEIKKRNQLGPKNTSNFFGFINVDIDDNSLQQCFEEFQSKKWKGNYVDVQLAKESFLERLKREREEAKQDKSTITDKAENSSKSYDSPIIFNQKTPNKNKTEINEELFSNDDKDTFTVIKKKKKTAVNFENEADDFQDEDEQSKSIVIDNYIEDNHIEENIEEIYTDIVVKNNKDKKLDNKIESVGNKPIIIVEKYKPKSKDPKRTEADQKRVKSMIEMKRGYQHQKSLIQAALSKIDVNAKSKKTFDDKIVNNEKKKQTEEKKSLFDGEDSDNEKNDEYNFGVKTQFQGKTGEKLFHLQSKFNNDARFQLDSRFAENDNIEDGNYENQQQMSVDSESQNEISPEEKQSQLEILEKVLGKKLSTRQINNKSYNSKGMLRFDPNQPDHSKYELTNENKDVKKKRKRKTSENENNITLPEVSTEKFYKVADTFKASEPEKESFSLLNMFGRVTYENTEEETANEQSEEIVKRQKNSLEENKNVFRYDSSTDDELDEAPADVNKEESAVKDETENYQIKLGPSRLWTESLFFQDDDYRFQEGLDFIKRLEVEEKSEFNGIRRDLKEIVRAKVRNNERKKRPFKKKLGGSARKKMIRVKKALKR